MLFVADVSVSCLARRQRSAIRRMKKKQGDMRCKSSTVEQLCDGPSDPGNTVNPEPADPNCTS